MCGAFCRQDVAEDMCTAAVELFTPSFMPRECSVINSGGLVSSFLGR